MKNCPKIAATLFLLILVQTLVLGQGFRKKVVLNWKDVQTIQGINYESVKALYADGLTNNSARNYTPEYFEKFALPANTASCDMLITHTEWETVSDAQLRSLTYALLPSDTLSPLVVYATERGVKMAMLTLTAVVVNPDGGIMRLKSFTVDMVYLPASGNKSSAKAASYATHSVLAQGNWYKIQLNKTGIYKLTYADIQAMGVDMASVNPANIRVFGNGGGLLPEANSMARHDDLAENAVKSLLVKNHLVELKYLHNVEPAKVPYYISGSDIVLLTSDREGSPNIIKEAMACNVPIVSTQVGDVKKVIGNTLGCKVVSLNQAEIIANALSEILSSTTKRTNGREKIQHLSDELIAKRLIKFYEK